MRPGPSSSDPSSDPRFGSSQGPERGSNPPLHGQPSRVLIVRLSHLGDAIGALPLFHALREALPGARIAWAIEREFAGLLEQLPGLDERLIFERASGWRAPVRFREFAARLRRFAPEVAIDAQGNAKSHLTVLASKAPRRFAPHLEECREPAACRLLRAVRPARTAGAHARDRLQHLANLVGAELVGRPLPLTRGDLDLSALERAESRERLAASFPRGLDWVFHLGRAGDIRSWSAQRSFEFLEAVRQRGERVLVLAGPAERDVARQLASRLPEDSGRVFADAPQPLRELAADLTAAAGLGARFVGPDSGPIHLAAACGLPCTLLAGPQDPARTGPWPPPSNRSPHRALLAPTDLACRPCLRRTCRFERPQACLEELPASAVFDRADGYSSRASTSATSS